MPMHRYIYGTTPVQYDWRHHEPRIPRRNYPRFIDQYEPYIRGFHIHRYLRRPYRVLAEIHHLDLILTIILSLSIGTAITLISSGKLKANANVFFFGSILTVNTTDMISIAVLTILSVLTLYFLYNSLLYIAYDEEAARVAGVKVDLINYVFAILMAAAVSISIKIVGVLVLSAMIALPVASALQLEKGFRTTLLCSIGFSLLAMIIGLFGSYYLNVAPGGFVSLTSVFILLVVLIIKNIKSIIRRMQFSK